MGRRVLITDDAAYMRTTLKEILSRNGYNVCGEAEDGLSAVTQYKTLKPDLVLLDISMPHKDGLQALKEIKAYNPAAVCIMCSAMGQPETVKAAIRSGARDFVVKPFQQDRIIEAVKKAIG